MCNRLLHRFILMFVGFSLTGMPLCAQQHYTRAQLDSLAFPKEIESADCWLSFDKLNVQLGTLEEEDTELYRTFTFTNKGTDTLSITRVRTSCGCTVPSYSKAAIAPGHSGKVILCYNPYNQVGTIDVDAFVYTTHSNNRPEVRLSLYGEVRCSDEWSHLPYQVGHLRLKHKEVHFTELKYGTHPSLRVLCANAGKKPLRLSARLYPAYVTFRTDPEVLKPNEEGDIVITLDTRRLPKTDKVLKGTIVMEGVSGKPSNCSLKVIVDPLRK